MQDINIDSLSNTKNMTTAINPVKPCPNSWIMGFNLHGSGKHKKEFQMVNCKIDTGAMANVLSLLLFRSLRSQLSLALQPSNVALCSYTKHQIPVYGEVTIKVLHNRRFLT